MKRSSINFPYRSFHRHYEENASAEEYKNLNKIYYTRDIVPKFRQYYKELANNLKLSDPNEIRSNYEMMKFCSDIANVPRMIYEQNTEKAQDDIISFYRNLAEGHEIIFDKSPKDMGKTIQYICQYPLRTICSLIYNAEHLEEYRPFFLDDNAPLPEYPMVEVRESESFESRLLEELEGLKLAFAIMGKWRNMAQIVETEDDEFDNFADDIDIAFDNYVRCYDLIGDDEIWRITFDLRKQWFDYLCGLDLLRGFDIERSLAGLTSCFCQLPPALYKLECRRYQEISKIRGVIFGRPIEKRNDMRGDCTLNDIQNKMYDMHRDVKDMKRDIKGGFARNDDYARQQRLSVPPDLSGDRRGKWAYGWRLKMVNAVFTLFNNGSGRPFDNICHEVYAENESDFNKKGISYNSFKRACDRQKNHRKKLT